MKKSIISLLALTLAVCTLFAGCSEFVYENEFVKLGEYKGLTTSSTTFDNMEEEVNTAIAVTLMNQQETPVTVEDRDTVQKGDVLNIDYEGKIKDIAFEGGTAKGATLIIGSDMFIPGFEDQLIGKKVGETSDIKVTFPTSYPTANLAGKEAVFTVTVNSIGAYPELTDEQASTLSYGQMKTVDEYKAYVSEQIVYQAITNKQNNIWLQIVDNSEIIKYPDGEIDRQLDEMMAYYEQMAASSEMTLEEYLTNYLGTTKEAFTAELTARCEDSIKQQLIKDAIAAAEGITLSDEEYKEGVANYAKELGFPDVETFESQYNVDVIKKSLIADKIMAMLEENAKEVEGFTYTSKN